jgi:hypothetical protein
VDCEYVDCEYVGNDVECSSSDDNEEDIIEIEETEDVYRDDEDRLAADFLSESPLFPGGLAFGIAMGSVGFDKPDSRRDGTFGG